MGGSVGAGSGVRNDWGETGFFVIRLGGRGRVTLWIWPESRGAKNKVNVVW